jgi:uroporphyrinogen-III decarboxylase
MTGRERLLAALNRACPDRVPVSTYELVGFNSRSFENQDPSYARLMQAIRELTDCVCMWDPASNAAAAKSDHLGDFLETTSHSVEMETRTTRQGDRTVVHRTLHTPQGDLTSTCEVFAHVQTVWKTEHWCKTIADVERLLSIPYEPVDYDYSDLARVRSEVGAHGIVMSTVFDPLGWAADMMRFEDALLWACTEPEHFRRTLGRIHERSLENLRRRLRGGAVDLYRIAGPEVATPPYLPREAFQGCVLPFVSEMVALIHDSNCKVRIHCHGRIGSVLDLIAATGGDALDPCEGPPDGDIPLCDVKARVGDRMCLFGNLQPRVLEGGSRAEIRLAVKQCMAAAKAGGGYVIMPTAAPIETPLPQKITDNYLWYIESALELGRYA